MKNQEQASAKHQEFPNGFDCWYETHHEVVSALTLMEQLPENKQPVRLLSTRQDQGTGGIWELALELTNKFEKLNEGREWDGEFYDEIYEFLERNLQN